VRRLVGVAIGVVLVIASNFVVARSAELPVTSETNIGAQLMLQLFGEVSDSMASFAAARGDRASESPFRQLALQVRAPAAKHDLDGAAMVSERFVASDVAADQAASFVPPMQFAGADSVVRFNVSPTSQDEIGRFTTSSNGTTAAYRPEPPVPAISPAPGTLAFTAPQIHADFLPQPAQIGSVKFESGSGNAAPQTPQLSLHDGSYGAGANFDLRAGKRNLNVNLSSEYDRLGAGDTPSFLVSPLGAAPSWQLSAASPPLVPNNADVNRLSLGAGLAVPVLHGLTLNLNYDAQHLYGGFAIPGLVNLDAVNDSYGGNLTFNIPRTTGSLSIGAYQDRYGDSLSPINGSSATRADVNFTVKF